MDILLNLSENLSLYMMIGIAVAFVLYFLLGMWRGLRKSIFKLIVTATFLVLLFFLADPVSKALYNIPIGNFVSGVLPSGVSGNTINEIAESFAGMYASPDMASEAVKIVLGILTIAVKLVYFTVFALLAYEIYDLFLMIFYWIFFKQRKKVDEDGKVIKPNKHRLFGGLVNGVKAALVYVIFSIILVNGPMGMLPSLKDTVGNDVQEQKLAQDIGDLQNNELFSVIVDLIENYKSSFFYTMFEGDGDPESTSINQILNSKIYNIEIDGETFDFRSEISSLLSVGDSVLSIYSGLNGASREIDYDNIAKVLEFLSDSKLINTLLPVAADIALNLDSVKNVLDEQGLDLSGVRNVNWSADFKEMSSLVKEVKTVVKDVAYIQESGQEKSLMNIDLDSINKENISKVFECVSKLTIITELIDTGVNYALNLQQVKDMIGSVTIDLEDIVWGDEICNIGDVFAAFLDLGMKTINEVTSDFKGLLDKLNFGVATDDEDTGSVGALVQALFASRLIDGVFANVMENVVLPQIPADYQSLFDFSSINDKGWSNEFVDLIKIFKDLKGTGEDPFFKEDGTLNFALVSNLRGETLCNSKLLSNAVISLFADAANGTGLLASAADVLMIPDVYKDKNASEWKTEELSYYVASVTFDTYKKYQRISIADYALLSAENKTKCNPQYKVVAGELYNLANALEAVADIVDLSNLNGAGELVSLSEHTLNSLVKEKEGKTAVAKLCTSTILSTTISGLLSNIDAILIPNTSDVCETVVVKGEDKVAIKPAEFERLLKALIKLEVVKDTYTCTKDIIIDGTMYFISDIFEGDYEALTSEQKDAFSISTNMDVSMNLVTTLNEEVDEQHHTKLDYITGCEQTATKDKIVESKILNATISNMILEMAKNDDSMIVMPLECVVTGSDFDYIKANDLRDLINGLTKLDIIREYKCIEDVGVYEIGDLISKDTYEALSSLEKQKFEHITPTIGADIESISNLLIVDDDVRRLDTVLESKVLTATISNLVQMMDGGPVVVPSTITSSLQRYNAAALEKYITVDTISNTELSTLISDIIKLDVLKNGNFHADIGLVSKLSNYYEYKENERTQEMIDASISSDDHQLIYYVCQSKIMTATITKYVLDAEDTLIIPTSTLNTEGTTKVLKEVELNNFVSAVNAMDIIAEYQCQTAGNGYEVGDRISKTTYNSLSEASKQQFAELVSPVVNSSIALVERLLEVEGSARKIDVIFDSDILSATFSKFILEEEGSLKIPSVIKESSTKYTKFTNEQETPVTLIKPTELKELLVAISEMEIINNGSIDTSLGIIGNISGNYAYKPNEQLIENEVDSLKIIDHINNSYIMRATIGDKIISQSSVIKLLDSTIVNIDSTYKALLPSELESLIDAINSLDIIDSSNNIKDINSMASDILNNTSKQNAIANSLTLRATLSDKISSTLEIPEDGINYYYNGNAISYAEYALLTPSQQATCSKTFASDGSNIKVISKEELTNMFKSLSLLGVSSFDNVDVTFSTIKSIKDQNKTTELLSSVAIWQKVSDSLLNASDGANPIFNAPTFGSDTIVEYTSGVRTIPQTYYDSLSSSEKAAWTVNNIDTYVKDIPNASTLTRLTMNEVSSIIDLMDVLGCSGDDFAINSTTLESVYSDPTVRSEFVDVISESSLLTHTVTKLLGTMVDDAVIDTIFEPYASEIKASLETINTIDRSLWKDHHLKENGVEEYANGSYVSLGDNELNKLFDALVELSNVGSLSPDELDSFYTIDKSFSMRTVLEVINTICYYEANTDIPGVCHSGDTLSIPKYSVVTFVNPEFNVLFTRHAYVANATNADRQDVIERAFNDHIA